MSTFRPSRSLGWINLVALGLLLLGDAAFVLLLGITVRQPAPLPVAVIEVAIAGLGVWFLALAAMFPTMRYEVAEGELRLRYGPMSWPVRLADITSVRHVDLQWSPWSSMRFPGLALFKVPYGGGMGNVRMCATRSMRNVLLIETPAGKYGVTPEDETAFLAALGRKATDEKGAGAL